MRNVTIYTVTEVVTDSLGKIGEITDRNRVLLTALIRHLHDFAREVKLQHSEFLFACDYLARAGRLSDDKRQEFILLGDILWLEVLVDMLTHPVDGVESESTVLGRSTAKIRRFCRKAPRRCRRLSTIRKRCISKALFVMSTAMASPA